MFDLHRNNSNEPALPAFPNKKTFQWPCPSATRKKQRHQKKAHLRSLIRYC